MNFVSICAQLAEEPREVYTSATSTSLRCNVILPPVGNKTPTTIALNIYGKSAERFERLKERTSIFIHGAKLRYDLDTRQFSLHGGTFVPVEADAFPILNTVILSGRCVKDIDQEDSRAFKTTAGGLMICNQSLAVNTGRNQSDLFNFYAINSVEDKPNYAELLCNLTHKGTGLTISGRLVTDSWKDKTTNELCTQTKIQMTAMTLGPKSQDSSREIKPQTTMAADKPNQSLWGGRTMDEQPDPWNQAQNSLPDLPGQYGVPPQVDDDVPF
jgi:single-stranded DNA-binding protein